jgi:hypothetical protein
MAAVNSTADPPAEPIPAGKFMKIKKKMRKKRNLQIQYL